MPASQHPAVGGLTSELQAAQLKGDEAVPDFDQVHKGVEVVRGQDEAVAGAVVAPPAQDQVSAEGLLQGPRQVFVEDGVAVVVLAR